jgi:hypothetical protein
MTVDPNDSSMQKPLFIIYPTAAVEAASSIPQFENDIDHRK